jgi:uncharacterized protein YyaL (SSP411 family)
MPNALAFEKSPYLLQHAANPVNWLPWGEAAFARARTEEKPIFLSIGYATCHWCHVMAHESFEDEAAAALLNEHFVAIKVDREERPDVDKVYMAYVQALTGHGGWPLSAWLTPELKPFFGGTYFSPHDRPGRAGFATLLRAIARGWREERPKLIEESERVLRELREKAEGRKPTAERAAEADLAEAAGEAFEKGFQFFYETFDADCGGFGGAPKFPRASNLAFLFRCAAQQGVTSELGVAALEMAGHTLRNMSQGGIHDHVGGGYHRYAVDPAWAVPHFEKMLYDQAQIALNALEMKQASGDERYAWMARDIFAYVAERLTGTDGEFFSAEDADSLVDATGRDAQATAKEGAFYGWDQTEIVAVLGGDAEFFGGHFGVKAEGNVPAEIDPQGELKGKNILRQVRPLAESARLAGLTTEQASNRLQAALEKLKAVRAARPRPLLDDKVITAWNGLMISALAKGAQVLGEERYLAAALRAAEFVARELYDETREVLYRSWRGGRLASEGFAEDYACFVQGLLDLYEATFDLRWLRWAERLQATMDRLFWDEAEGGYFSSAAGARDIVVRLKEDYDGAEPAPSSVAAMNLFRLGALIGDQSAQGNYRRRGVATVAALRAQWTGSPQGLPQLLCALELAFLPPRHVVLAGDPAAEDFRALAAVVHEKFGPRRTLVRAYATLPWTAPMEPLAGRAAAYVCEDYTCQLPVVEPAELRRVLG